MGSVCSYIYILLGVKNGISRGSISDHDVVGRNGSLRGSARACVRTLTQPFLPAGVASSCNRAGLGCVEA